MPDRDGDHIYRIKSPVEEYGRAVKEGLLVKSQGYLPEEIKDQGPREASITLPSLLHVEKGRSSMFCRWAVVGPRAIGVIRQELAKELRRF